MACTGYSKQKLIGPFSFLAGSHDEVQVNRASRGHIGASPHDFSWAAFVVANSDFSNRRELMIPMTRNEIHSCIDIRGWDDMFEHRRGVRVQGPLSKSGSNCPLT